MQDFVVFLFQQLGNLILWFDSFEIIGTITLFRLLIIFILFMFIMKYIKGDNKDDDK